MLAFLLLAAPLLAQTPGGVAVVVKENQTIREISRQHLGNPDLWEDILRANNLASVAEVKPGITLRIPVQAITDANKALEKASKLIQEATKNGARIFAAAEINRAIEQQDQAILKRKAGAWGECASLAKASAVAGQKALDIALKNKNVAADAAVAFRKGDVEKKKPVAPTWEDAPLHSVLLEQDRVRTLAKSYAEIQFRDDSRLRLNENSQALIKKMRANLVDNTGESSVSLIEGDVMALLTGGRGEGSFKLDVPDVETKVNSQRFWVSRKEETARFANYNGELEVAASGAKVTIKENQGSVVPKGKPPTPPRNLLSAPELQMPASEAEIFDPSVTFSWSAVDGADRYLLEFAVESGFTRLETSAQVKGLSGLAPQNLGDGLHYWRVSAVGNDGLPGLPSAGRIVRFITDNAPPFLAIATPADSIAAISSPVIVSGTTEGGAKLSVGVSSGDAAPDASTLQSLEAGESGVFKFSWNLNPGVNRLLLRAVDRAGNKSEATRFLTYITGEVLPLAVEPKLPRLASGDFVASAPLFTVAGMTAPKREVKAVAVKTNQNYAVWSDDQGRFQLNLRLFTPVEEYAFTVISQTGIPASAGFTVHMDADPPVITLVEPPSRTASPSLRFEGEVVGGVSLIRGGESVRLDGGRFSDEAPLRSGENLVRYSASDEAGNITAVERTIYCDPDPPKLDRFSVAPPTPKGGESVTIQVIASDASPLRQTAPFKLQIGEWVYEDLLRLTDPAKGIYSAAVRAPFDVKGTARLVSVTLTDQLGTSLEYNPSSR